MKKKLILAYADDGSDSIMLYDENGNLIRGWEAGDCMTFVFTDLCKHLGITFETATVREIDGEYPQKIQRI